MKTVMVCALAAGAVALGACATTTTTDRSAALSAGEIKAELAAISQELAEIDVAVRTDKMRAESRTRPVAAKAGVFGRVAVAPLYDLSFEDPHGRRSVTTRRLMGRIIYLARQREELRAQLAKVEGPLGAEDIRLKISEIDQDLARRGQELAPSSAAPFSSTSYYAPGAARPVLSSDGPRSSDWRRTYRLKEERNALYAKLQMLESSQE